MSLTVTLHLWWLGAYLVVGVVLLLPLEWLAWRSIASPKKPFWSDYWFHVRRERWRAPLRVFVPVVLWPAAIWEAIR